jgi:hypothetical protein
MYDARSSPYRRRNRFGCRASGSVAGVAMAVGFGKLQRHFARRLAEAGIEKEHPSGSAADASWDER